LVRGNPGKPNLRGFSLSRARALAATAQRACFARSARSPQLRGLRAVRGAARRKRPVWPRTTQAMTNNRPERIAVVRRRCSLQKLIAARSRFGPPLTADESRYDVIWNQCHAAQFAALPDPNEPPISLLLALVVITSPKSEVWIAAGFG